MPNSTLRPHQQVINDTLEKKFVMLHFPEPLEELYRQHHVQLATTNFRYRSLVILFLYFVLSTGIVGLLPPDTFREWLNIYGWVGIIIIAAGLLSHINRLVPWFEWYVGLGSMMAVALSFVVATIPFEGISSVLSHAGIMYAIIIIYGFVGIRFYTACLAGWLGGAIGVLLSLWLREQIDWQLFHRTYTNSSILGMCLAYAADYQERVKFLQSSLLKLAHADLEEKNLQLAELTQQDALTGLANRRYMQEVLEQEWHRACRQRSMLTLIMIDIDYFKLYNDYWGHGAGDQCLQQIAQAIKSRTSRAGELVARYGGEEFLVLLPNVSPADVELYIHHLQQDIKALAIAHPKSTVSDYVTLSIGVTSHIPNVMKDGLSELMKQADIALYKAKDAGRNRYEVWQSDVIPINSKQRAMV